MFNYEIVKDKLDYDRIMKYGDAHQELMDLIYEEWRKRLGTSYGEMISWTEEKYGELVAFAVLIGKCNYQVCNGGWIQYLYNGYAEMKRLEICIFMIK